MTSSQHDPRPGQDDTIGGDGRDEPSLAWIPQALEAERIIREQIKVLEAQGFIRVLGTAVWTKGDELGRVVANFAL